MSFTFTNQVEENVGFRLQFPYHVNHERLLATPSIPYPAAQVTSSFESLLHKAYNEPFAVFLNDEDKQFYSAQELTLFDKVIALEQKRISEGMCKIELELEDDTLDAVLEYRTKHNMTFEQAIVDILQVMIAKNLHASAERKDT